MRLIDADKFKMYVKNGFDESVGYFETEKYAELAKEVTAAFLEDIDEQPTVYAQSVRRGEWIEVDEDYIMCSNCKEKWNEFDNDCETFFYCPNCGSYNEGKENL